MIFHYVNSGKDTKKATIQIVTFFYFLKKEILFLVTVTITAHELINTSGCIDQLRLTSVERVRSAGDFQLYQRISFAFESIVSLVFTVERDKNTSPFDISLNTTGR